MSAKEIVVSWDGEPSTWADYCRKVRLQYEKTPRKKRSLLGPELASRLTHKAWTVTAELDHYKLSKKNGVKYLLMFLKEKLCRTAVHDAGARLGLAWAWHNGLPSFSTAIASCKDPW